MVTRKIDKLAAKRSPSKRSASRAQPTSTWDDLIKIGLTIPDEDLAKLPTDLVKNFDHYAHGSPQED